ncbi:hypothetical protein [Devosia sp.]|uniref:hypothetical protein n=1 Tax=Devosia sp. TaxID=1871048 RepID=UPI0035B0F21E
MKTILLAGLALWAGAAPAQALECPLSHASYGQAGHDVEMRFRPLSPDDAVNQILAFRLSFGGIDEVFDGGVYIPNGFGSALGSIGVGCVDDFDTDCRFWEGTVYVLLAGGIAELPHESGQMAPQQVLLPQFAQAVWYSGYRGAGFGVDLELVDVFNLKACSK